MGDMASSYNTGGAIGVYIHVPYCRRRCPYCDFLSQATPGNAPVEYIDALCREIAAFDGPRAVCSVFLGGGTPSLLEPAGLTRLFEALARHFALADDAEISLEANPDDVTPELADAWRTCGVNRVSIGVQSFDDRVLQYLGRRHDAAGALRACDLVARRFDNWAMDLIFGAPPWDAWAATLARCNALRPAHVSAYGLTYEPGTSFEARQDDAVDDTEWLRLYHEAEQALAGYVHYEISNYALPGRECRHNLIYWHNESYAGFGPGAYSFLYGVRSRNSGDIARYVSRPGEKEERLTLSEREIRMETVIQHLRLREGLARAYYAARFGAEVDEDFGEPLAQLAVRGLVADQGDRIVPTAAGFELNNEIGLALVG